jgi:predicted MFS family arabinose efflux permease
MLVLFGGAANLVLTAYDAIVVVFLVRVVGLSSALAGLLLAAGSVGGVLGALAAPALARRFGSARALLGAKVGAMPMALLIPLAAPGWRLGLFVLGALALVGGIVAGNVISAGFLPGYCPPELMGRVTTSMQVVNFGTIPVGAVLGGLLADGLGFRPALWVVFGGLVASSLVLFASPLRGRRDLPTRA